VRDEGSSRVSCSVNFTLPALLTAVFIALKLTGVVDWSWTWVLSPLWIGVLLVFIGMMFAGLAWLFGRDN
jgi:hypothetical protein